MHFPDIYTCRNDCMCGAEIAMRFKTRCFVIVVALAGLLQLLVLYEVHEYSCSACSVARNGSSDRQGSPETPPLRGKEEDECNTTVTYRSCETIHIVFVVAGYGACRSLTTVLKSLLFYRHNPLHFHLIVDEKAYPVLLTLFQSWELPSVSYGFYFTRNLVHNISWIKNVHYSGVYGLMKLLLPSTVAVDRVIAMDTDVTVVTDVQELWDLFNELRKNKRLLGLVENQSNWYLGTLWEGHLPWPAAGRGYNTGVMLLDLEKMREVGWDEMWTSIAKETLHTHKYTALADQDIINAVIKNRTGSVHTLPCSWNIQLSDNTLSEICYKGPVDYKIIHWNSPQKTNIANKDAPYFRNLHYSFRQYDGYLLRQGLLHCSKTLDSYRISVTDQTPCAEFEEEAKLTYRTHLFFAGTQQSSAGANDVTLVSQLSIDRLQVLATLFKHWDGPVSVVMYASDSEVWQMLQYFEAANLLQKRKNIAVHVVYKQGQLYPVNFLRNVALSAVSTPFVFLLDIDFLPMFGLFSYLREAVKVLQVGVHKRALIAPAFETLQYKFTFPKSKSMLLKLLTSGKLQVFRHSVWKRGHAATDYDHWVNATRPYKIEWAPDFEPYITVSSNVTPYDTRFLGFGWNKVSHIMELDAQGYEFIVLPDAFIIHTPHAPSMDIVKYRISKQYRDCLQDLKDTFMAELAQRFNTSKYRSLYTHR